MGYSAINPRASYKAALNMAGINQPKGIDKQGSRYDFKGALGLGTDDPTEGYQASKDSGALSQSSSKLLSDATTNYDVLPQSNNQDRGQGIFQDASKIALGNRYVVK